MKVEVISPASWYGRTTYRLLENKQVGDFIVPAGFITDGATIPRFLWCLLPPNGSYFDEAVLHDYLVRNYVHSTRKESDRYFYRVLKDNGKNKVLSHMLYLGAKIGTFFNKYGIDLAGNGITKK